MSRLPQIHISSDSGLPKISVDHISSLGSMGDVNKNLLLKCQEKKGKTQRKALAEQLKIQYAHSGIELSGKVLSNINALVNEDAFTVTTGHQLCIFSGPLYVLEKIASVVKIADSFNKVNSAQQLIPVYWMATEDHDVDEISSVRVFRDKLVADFGTVGPTGNLDSAAVQKLTGRLIELAGDLPHAKEINDLIQNCYQPGVKLKHAHRKFIHALTAHLGVLIVDGDDEVFKKQFAPVLEKEISGQAVYKAVTKQNEKLIAAGYKAQVNPRDINVFLLDEHSRQRIEKKGENFKLADSDKSIDRKDILDWIKNKPHVLSPNVLLRPSYQCTVLPDVAVVGGPAEIAYWKQLDGLFTELGIEMPLILPRMFCFYVNEKQENVLNGLLNDGINFFGQEETWVNARAKKSTGLVSFRTEEQELDRLFETLKNKAMEVDKSLPGFIDAEKAKSKKFMDALNDKIIRAVKKNEETQLSSIRQLHAKLFPEGSWQERYESALPWLWKFGKGFMDELVKHHPDAYNQIVFIKG